MQCRIRRGIPRGLLVGSFWAATVVLGAAGATAEPGPGKLVLFTAEEAVELRLAEGEPLPGTLGPPIESVEALEEAAGRLADRQ